MLWRNWIDYYIVTYSFQPSPRDHVTVINVASSANNIFNFEDVGAVLESSSGVNPSQLYGTEDTDELNHNSLNDPNAIQMRVGNSLGAGGSAMSYG